MIKIIISKDPSTSFLYGIIENLKSNNVGFELIEIHPSEVSYADSYEVISKLSKSATIVFLGHGTNERLYGGESLPQFEKKSFIKLNEMNIFEGQNLFLLSCNSSGLIQSSYRLSKFNKSIGFGELPTSLQEVENNKRLSTEGILEETIADFKSEIVNIISKALANYHNDFDKLKDYLTLFIDQRINNAVLFKNDRNLADLLFKMRNEMVIF